MEFFEFGNRSQAAAAVGERMVRALQRRLENSERASMVVSGGTTPAPVFAYLAQQDVPWQRVDVLLSDERWVPPQHPDSNEGMLRESLAGSPAADANIIAGFDRSQSPDSRCSTLGEELARLQLPFASVLLGMGTDGHFASLFPDAANLHEGLASESALEFITIDTPSSPYLRVSMTLAALLQSDEILLLISGAEKRARLAEAARSDSNLPVAHLIKQTQVPVLTFWAP